MGAVVQQDITVKLYWRLDEFVLQMNLFLYTMIECTYNVNSAFSYHL